MMPNMRARKVDARGGARYCKSIHGGRHCKSNNTNVQRLSPLIGPSFCDWLCNSVGNGCSISSVQFNEVKFSRSINSLILFNKFAFISKISQLTQHKFDFIGLLIRVWFQIIFSRIRLHEFNITNSVYMSSISLSWKSKMVPRTVGPAHTTIM